MEHECFFSLSLLTLYCNNWVHFNGISPALHNGVSHLCDSTKYLQLTGHRPFAFTFIFGVIAIAAAYGAVAVYISMADHRTASMVGGEF